MGTTGKEPPTVLCLESIVTFSDTFANPAIFKSRVYNQRVPVQFIDVKFPDVRCDLITVYNDTFCTSENMIQSQRKVDAASA